METESTGGGGSCPRRVNRSMWCGLCYANHKGKANYVGHLSYRPVRKEKHSVEWYVMKRPDQPAKGQKTSVVVTDASWSEKFPTVITYMTDAKWDDGKPREPSTLSINFSTGSPTISLSDHALQQSAYTTADTVAEALELLEEALVEGKVRWRPWKAFTKR